MWIVDIILSWYPYISLNIPILIYQFQLVSIYIPRYPYISLYLGWFRDVDIILIHQFSWYPYISLYIPIFRLVKGCGYHLDLLVLAGITISLYIPIYPYISLYIPVYPYISLYIPIYPYISLYLGWLRDVDIILIYQFQQASLLYPPCSAFLGSLLTLYHPSIICSH